DTRERRFFGERKARISWSFFPSDERANAVGMGKAPRHCPQRATGETYQSGAGRRSILPAIRRRHLPDTLRRRAAVERSARGVESCCAFVRARFGRRIRRVERRARAAIAARARDGGGLAGCDPDHAEGHSAFWCRGPIPF